MSNPFDLGNLGGLMAGLQRQMEEMKSQAAATEVEGRAGGGLVKVVANGSLEIVRIEITEDAAQDREMLEDLLVAAANDALRQARALLGDKVGALAGGLLPPGLL